MDSKITKELQKEIETSKGPYRVSIRPDTSKRLDSLVTVNRYESMGVERIRLIKDETQSLLSLICRSLECYGLVLGKDYMSDEVIRNVSAILNKDQIIGLANEDYVRKIDINLQKNLPF